MNKYYCDICKEELKGKNGRYMHCTISVGQAYISVSLGESLDICLPCYQKKVIHLLHIALDKFEKADIENTPPNRYRLDIK